jgi:hypothetical protein
MTETTRAGGFRRPVFYLILAAVLMIAASCYSTSYPKQMTANVDLMAELADKLEDYARAGFIINDRPISSEEMGEFYYGLKKAQGFAASRRGDANHASYRDFASLIDQFGAFVHSADEYRLATQRDPKKLDALTAQKDALELTVSQVRRDLISEEESH